MSILDKAKEHPYEATAIALVGMLAIYLLLSSGGSGSPTATLSGSSQNDVAAATQAYAIQQQAALQGQQYSTALQAQSESDAAGLALEKIHAATTSEANNLTASVDLAQINEQGNIAALGANVTNTANTLTLQSNEAALNERLAEVSLNTSASVANQTTIANALVAQNNNQTEVEKALISGQTTVAGYQAGIGQQLAQNQAPRSLLQEIFG